MDAITNLFSELGPFIIVVGFLGAAAIYLRGSKDSGTIATLSKNNAALTERVTVLEKDASIKDAQIQALTTANQVLANTVTGAEKLDNVLRQLGEIDRNLQLLLEAQRNGSSSA